MTLLALRVRICASASRRATSNGLRSPWRESTKHVGLTRQFPAEFFHFQKREKGNWRVEIIATFGKSVLPI